MKKVFLVLLASMIVGCSSRSVSYETYRVKLNDGSELEIVGYDAELYEYGFVVFHEDGDSYFSKDKTMYVIKLGNE